MTVRNTGPVAGEWLLAERKRLGWSATDLVGRINDLTHDFRWLGQIPSCPDVRALESGQLPKVPRWLRLARYAIELAAIPASEYQRWLAERNYFFSNDLLRMTRPALFEDEGRMIGDLDALSDKERTAIQSFTSNFAHRRAYQSDISMVTALLSKLDLEGELVAGDERELLTCFRSLPHHAQGPVLRTIRDLAQTVGPSSIPSDNA